MRLPNSPLLPRLFNRALFNLSRAVSSQAAPDTDVIVIGAGAVGLAIARQLAVSGRDVVLIEAAPHIGTETSSRNSGVIHAGLYYAPGSVKATTCVEGRRLLYDFCATHGVPHKRLGKLLVATSDAQVPQLLALRDTAAANGVTDLQLLGAEAAMELEPALKCTSALLSPSTGIVDVHAYMAQLLRQFEEAGGVVALNSTVVSGTVDSRVKRLTVRGAGSGSATSISSRAVVNAAGLHAPSVSEALQGCDPSRIPPLFLCKGNYFELAGPAPFTRLIYPMPGVHGGLGVHLTLDLSGAARFGPDTQWLPRGTPPSSVAYDVDTARQDAFEAAVREYYPGLPEGALLPGYAGIRPKVVGPGEPAGDFMVEAAGPGVVALYGIESPGLTASLALAQVVARQLERV